MKLSATVKKTISAILLMLLMAGGYGGVIALCNQYLRTHDLITPVSKAVLIMSLVGGFYLIYRWFSKRLDVIPKKESK